MFRKCRLIDLSVPLEHNAASKPLPAKIHYVRHDSEGLQQMQQFFSDRQSLPFTSLPALARAITKSTNSWQRKKPSQ